MTHLVLSQFILTVTMEPLFLSLLQWAQRSQVMYPRSPSKVCLSQDQAELCLNPLGDWLTHLNLDPCGAAAGEGANTKGLHVQGPFCPLPSQREEAIWGDHILAVLTLPDAPGPKKGDTKLVSLSRAPELQWSTYRDPRPGTQGEVLTMNQPHLGKVGIPSLPGPDTSPGSMEWGCCLTSPQVRSQAGSWTALSCSFLIPFLSYWSTVHPDGVARSLASA